MEKIHKMKLQKLVENPKLLDKLEPEYEPSYDYENYEYWIYYELKDDELEAIVLHPDDDNPEDLLSKDEVMELIKKKRKEAILKRSTKKSKRKPTKRRNAKSNIISVEGTR